MNITKLKQIVSVLLWCGVGVGTSSVLGLDGFRDTIQPPQLIIGVCLVVIAMVMHLIVIKQNK